MKILTYNILSPTLAKYQNYKNHKYCPIKYIKWSYRKNKILKQIKKLDVHILCMQEMENDIYNDFIPFMTKLGYIGLFVPKNKKNINGCIDGCALYIKNTYQFIKYKTIDYYGNYVNLLNGNKKNINRAKKPMCGLVCLIKKKKSNKVFCISTVHLVADPNKPDVKHLQILYVLQEISLMTNNGEIPFILCGDFNSLPDSSVYNTIVNGTIDQNHKDFLIPNSIKIKTNKLNIKADSVYKLIHNTEPEYTNYVEIFNGTLDYIFVSNHWKVKKARLINKKDKLTKRKYMPNSKIPSDHLPIYSNIILKKSKI